MPKTYGIIGRSAFPTPSAGTGANDGDGFNRATGSFEQSYRCAECGFPCLDQRVQSTGGTDDGQGGVSIASTASFDTAILRIDNSPITANWSTGVDTTTGVGAGWAGGFVGTITSAPFNSSAYQITISSFPLNAAAYFNFYDDRVEGIRVNLVSGTTYLLNTAVSHTYLATMDSEGFVSLSVDGRVVMQVDGNEGGLPEDAGASSISFLKSGTPTVTLTEQFYLYTAMVEDPAVASGYCPFCGSPNSRGQN